MLLAPSWRRACGQYRPAFARSDRLLQETAPHVLTQNTSRHVVVVDKTAAPERALGATELAGNIHAAIPGQVNRNPFEIRGTRKTSELLAADRGQLQ